MAKVQLNKASRKVNGFSIWVAGMLNVTQTKQSDLAKYLGLDRSGISMRIHGKTPWTLREFYETQEFFEEEFKHED